MYSQTQSIQCLPYFYALETMTSLKKAILSVSVAALSMGVLAPIASAQVAEGTTDGATVTRVGNDNAAAAVHIEYDGRRVESLSAASSFGEESAMAAAGPMGATSVGTSATTGSVEFLETSLGSLTRSSVTVDFGGDIN